MVRSFYDTALFNFEAGGGGSAPEGTVPADQGSTPPQGASEPQQKTDDEKPLQDQLSAIWEKNNSGPLRDPNGTGRFVSRNPKQPDAQPDDDDLGELDELDDDLDDGSEKRTTEEGELDEDLTAGQEKPGSKRTTEVAPRSWSKVNPEVWNSMPAEARDFVRRREGQMEELIGRAGNAVNFQRQYEPIIQGVEPYREYLAQREQHTGVSSGKLINDVLRFAHGFDTAQTNETRLGILSEIVNTFGIDIGPWIGREAAEALRGSQPANDPRVDNLTRVVETLTQRLQKQDEIEQAKSEQTMADTIKTFADNKKDYPYFKYVRERMSREIGLMDEHEANASMEDLMKVAYERACWAVPKVRAHMMRKQAETSTEAQEQRRDDKRQRAERAAATNVKSGIPSPSKRTMDDDIEATASRIYGR